MFTIFIRNQITEFCKYTFLYAFCMSIVCHCCLIYFSAVAKILFILFIFFNSIQSWEEKKRETLRSECHIFSFYLSQSFPVLLALCEQWMLWFAPKVILSAVVGFFSLPSEKDCCDSSKLLCLFTGNNSCKNLIFRNPL